MKPTYLFLWLFLVAAALGGCGSSPKPNFYTLDADMVPKRTEVKAVYTVAIGPVTVPDLLDRPQIVTRTSTNQVAINEFERWAEPVRSQIGRVVAANLSQSLDGAYVYAYPQSATVDADYKLLIDVQRFDSMPADAVAVDVLWTLRPAKGAPRTGRSVVREPINGKGYHALVAAHSRALVTISSEIAQAVRASQ